MLSSFAINIEEEFDINPSVIAKGSFGYVNEAHRKSDNLHVAIKTMIDDDINFISSKYLLRELQLLAGIRHPNCLQLIAFTLSPIPKIVTPFMGNGTLNDALMDKCKGKPNPKFTPTKMMCTLYGICATMQFLHDNRIIHRDFKPLNIFLNENFDICIADFGLSRKVEENIYLTMKEIGTPLYIAPELFNDEFDTYNNKIDVFSFGVSYLQYFTFSLVLNDGKGKIKSASNLKNRIRNNARFKQPKGMNDKQYEIYINCTLPDPNDRPSFQQLCDVFEKEDVWFEDTNKEEFLNYIDQFKQISQKEEDQPTVSKTKKKHSHY